jgi:anti-sigma regulatory factor (Ser/Thr protein kinase)
MPAEPVTSPGSGEQFAIELPVEPAHFGAARLFSASIARHHGCDQSAVEDLKIAVSEACTNVLFSRRGRPSDEPVRLVATKQADRLLFHIRDGGVALVQAPADSEGEQSTDELGRLLGVELIRSLFPDAQVEINSAGGMDLSFSLPCEPG